MKSFYKLTILALSSLTLAMLQGETQTTPKSVPANQPVLAAPTEPSRSTQDVPKIENPPLGAIMPSAPKIAELESKLNNLFTELETFIKNPPENSLIVKAFEESFYGNDYKIVNKNLSNPNLSTEERQRLEQSKKGYELKKEKLGKLPEISKTIKQIENFIKRNNLNTIFLELIEHRTKDIALHRKPEIKMLFDSIENISNQRNKERRNFQLKSSEIFQKIKPFLNKFPELSEIQKSIAQTNNLITIEKILFKNEALLKKIPEITTLLDAMENISNADQISEENFKSQKNELLMKIKENPDFQKLELQTKSVANQLEKFREKIEGILRELFNEQILIRFQYIEEKNDKLSQLIKDIVNTISQILEINPNFDIKKILENKDPLTTSLLICTDGRFLWLDIDFAPMASFGA